MKYNPHAASSQNKSWPGHRLSSPHYAANAKQPLLVRWCWRWPGITGQWKKTEAATGQIEVKLIAGTWSTLKTLPEDLPEAKVFPFWLPCCPVLGLASEWFLEILGLCPEAFVLRNRVFVTRIHCPREIQYNNPISSDASILTNLWVTAPITGILLMLPANPTCRIRDHSESFLN